MRILKILIFAIFISGCSIKTISDPYDMYEIYYKEQGCQKQSNMKNLLIQNIKALEVVDTRQILTTFDGKISYLKNARYISLPSEMFYKAIAKAFYENCKIAPALVANSNTNRLKVSIFNFEIYENFAKVGLAYELTMPNLRTVSNFIKKDVLVKNTDSKSMFEAINQASNEAIYELLDQILELR